MGNIIGGLAVALTIAAVAIQYRQIKKVSVPMIPWGQVILWATTILCGFTAFIFTVHWLMIIPVSLAIVANIFFIIVVIFSPLPKVDPAISVGDRYIDFTLPDSEGRPFTLSSMEGKPILLKFFRGHWCTYCSNELAAYAKYYDAYRELGIEMVVLSADTVKEARKMKDELGLKATVLSDEHLSVIDKYRVRHDGSVTGARQLVRPVAVPTAMLISADGLVRWIEVSTNNRVRIDPMTILVKSKTTLEKCSVTNKTRLSRAGSNKMEGSDDDQNQTKHGDD